MGSKSIEKSVIAQDIADIMENHKDKYNPMFSFEVKLHTKEKDLDYTDALSMVDLHIVRNYEANMCDYIEVRLNIPLGTFMYDVYEFLENIEVTIITYKQLFDGDKQVYDKERYKAIYLLEKNTSIPNMVNQTRHDLNQQLPIMITLQLLDRASEVIRIKTMQGNFDRKINKNPDMGIETFMRSVLSDQINKIRIDEKVPLHSLNIEKPDNIEKLKAVTIPSFTRIVELAEYLQQGDIGVYSAGIGSYIQNFGVDPFNYKKTMFVYSLYNGKKKYQASDYKIIIYSPVTSTYSSGDITYKYKDKVLKILAHSIPRILDNKEISVMSDGSGYRTTHAECYMKKPVEMKKDGPYFKKERIATEIAYKEREDNLNFAVARPITGNQFKYASEVLKKEGNYLTVEVNNLDHDFIYPGAKCKIVYENRKGKVGEIFGLVHMADIIYMNQNLNLPMNHSSRTVTLSSRIILQVFCNGNSADISFDQK